MSDATRTDTVTTFVIKLMSGSGIFESTETSAVNVGQLRSEKDLSGTIVVNDVIATDTTPLSVNDRVSHVQGGKRGGQSS